VVDRHVHILDLCRANRAEVWVDRQSLVVAVDAEVIDAQVSNAAPGLHSVGVHRGGAAVQPRDPDVLDLDSGLRSIYVDAIEHHVRLGADCDTFDVDGSGRVLDVDPGVGVVSAVVELVGRRRDRDTSPDQDHVMSAFDPQRP